MRGKQIELNHVLQEIPSQYLRPFHHGDCSKLHNCLACMTDASCGWCGATSTCAPRSLDSSCSGHQKTLVLNATECPVCTDYIDCYLCSMVRGFLCNDFCNLKCYTNEN